MAVSARFQAALSEDPVAKSDCLKPTLRSPGFKPGLGAVMSMRIRFTTGPESQWRRTLERCWLKESDIDPLILRARLLHRQGHHRDACAVHEELQPVF